MGEAFELQKLPQPLRIAQLAPEAESFKSFQKKFSHNEGSRVVSLAFSPCEPHRVAVASGTKVGFWSKSNSAELENVSNISKFHDYTQCVAWRPDGRLVLAGEASGTCAIIEVANKNVLRRLRGHGDAVTCCAFATADKSRAATGCRDGRLRIWDVPTAELLQTTTAHADCLKVVCPGPGGPDMWITAGYDGRVKLWDLRMGAPGGEGGGGAVCVTDADHGHPVEDGAAYPGGSLFVTVGGSTVKVWDLASSATPVYSMTEAHSKAIMAVSLDRAASTLLTASFDGYAKVWHAADLRHIYTYKLPGPATSASWRPDGNAFVVGMDDGQWVLRQRKTSEEAKAAEEARRQERLAKLTPAKREGHLRGWAHEPEEGDEVISDERIKKRKEFHIDYLFRKFEYKKVVEYMVRTSTTPRLGLSIVEQLLQQGALAASLTEIGEEQCLAMTMWLLKAFNAGDNLQQHLLHEALHTLLDNNRCLQPPCNPKLVDALLRLEGKIIQDIRNQEVLLETQGMLRAVLMG